MVKEDKRFLRVAFEVARRARENGNHPFGAILVDKDGNIVLKAENTVVDSSDCTGHAEMNLISRATSTYDGDFLAQCTIYASTEPCPMCAGAIFWSNIRRVVYGLSEESLYRIIGGESEEVLYLPCREIFVRGKKAISVVGPMLEDEASDVHGGFWT